jgi:hypothetical protein
MHEPGGALENIACHSIRDTAAARAAVGSAESKERKIRKEEKQE